LELTNAIRSDDMTQHIIPYARHLKIFGRDLRMRMTRAEAILWRELKGRRMFGCAFDRQHPIDHFIVDFYCKSLALVIEVDGITHDNDRAVRYDERRQVRLASLGVTVLRFTDDEVVHNLDGVLTAIRRWVRLRLAAEVPYPNRNKG
jgi:very-short-patch-repair endonuclease